MARGLRGRNTKERTWISRAALEMAITNAVRNSNPLCNGFVGIIVERTAPASRVGANWNVRGIKYGKAKRDLCDATISVIIDPIQLEFDITD
jgi:hypothetical protein